MDTEAKDTGDAKDWAKKAIEVVSLGGRDGMLLTWDRVDLQLSEYGKSLGLSDRMFTHNVQKIEICIGAGEVGHLIVTCLTDCKSPEELLASFPEEIRKADIWFHNSVPGDFNLWSIRFPLKSLSAHAFPPYIKSEEDKP